MKNMQNIHDIVFVISSLTSGGAERVMAELANYYNSIGINVKIILFSYDDVAYAVSPGVEIIYLCNEVVSKNRILKVFKKFFRLRRYLKNLKSDIVISFLTTANMYSCLAAHTAGKKVIVSERNDPSRIYNAEWRHKARNMIYRLADGFVFQTDDAKAYFKGKINQKAVIIPNPVKAELPEPYTGVRRKTIVACGRLNSQKNYPMLLRAFSNLGPGFSAYTLEIYGEGELLNRLEDEAEKLGINKRVLFCGNRNDWHARARDASLYVMSSDYEGIPNALMEAIACGIPSISTDCPCGGPRMLIQDGKNGLLVPVGSDTELTEAMKKVLNDSELAARLSLNGPLLRKRYSVDKIAGDWLAYVQDTV